MILAIISILIITFLLGYTLGIKHGEIVGRAKMSSDMYFQTQRFATERERDRMIDQVAKDIFGDEA